MTWRIVHYLGMSCLVPESEVLARSGLTVRELSKRIDVQLSGCWRAVRVKGA